MYSLGLNSGREYSSRNLIEDQSDLLLMSFALAPSLNKLHHESFSKLLGLIYKHDL